jgi:hypothetical protein
MSRSALRGSVGNRVGRRKSDVDPKRRRIASLVVAAAGALGAWAAFRLAGVDFVVSTSKGRMGAPDLSDQRSYRGTASRARARGPDLLLTRRCRRSPEHHR